MSNEIEYQIVQDDMVVAGVSGADALNEIKRYAAQYEQDGPIEVYEVTRKLVDLAAASPANGAAGEMPEPDLRTDMHYEMRGRPAYSAEKLRAAVLAERNAIASDYEKQANEYINDHADYEPETGAVVWEFGDAGRDYHSMLLELAESVRART